MHGDIASKSVNTALQLVYNPASTGLVTGLTTGELKMMGDEPVSNDDAICKPRLKIRSHHPISITHHHKKQGVEGEERGGSGSSWE